MAESTQEEQLAQQKAQCPFCQIIDGNIPAKKVYEDEKLIAILDINPATKGHVLVIPKEHFPLLALCPPDLFPHMFQKSRDIAKCVEDGVLSQGVELFIASGGAAGQQSMHFMLHLIPREPGDNIDIFELPDKEFPEDKQKQLKEAIRKNMAIALGRRFGTISTPKVTKEQILDLIEKNPQLKKVILENPDELRKAIPTNPQLKSLFEDVDVEDIILDVRNKAGLGESSKDNSDKENTSSTEEETKRIGETEEEPQVSEHPDESEPEEPKIQEKEEPKETDEDKPKGGLDDLI